MPYGYGHARFLSSRLNSNSSPRSGIYLNHAKSEVKDHSTKVGARFHNIIVCQSLPAYPYIRRKAFFIDIIGSQINGSAYQRSFSSVR